MTPFEVAVEGIWLTLIAFALLRYRACWKDRAALARLERTGRRVFGLDGPALQGWLRAQLAMGLGGLFLAVFPAAVLLRTATGSVRLALALVVLFGFVGFALMMGCAVAIVLFNVPKFLVFPALRDQEGRFAAWRRRRRGSN